MAKIIKNIRHFGIAITDIQKSLHFYCDLLGFKIIRQMNENGKYIDNMLKLQNVKVTTIKLGIDDDNTLVELLKFESHEELSNLSKIYSIGASHLALTVSDLENLYMSLIESGIEFNAPPQLSPDGLVKVTFCKDPDGTPIELVEELKQ
jgi:catechol 2,3-dioxygenase-like lactoylglutathione lyase family enzyme